MSRVLVMICGSIAAYKTATVLSQLKQRGHEIEVVASDSALEFLGEATIEGLTGRPVRTELFERGRHMAHIDLIRWSDLVLVCPATANTLNKFASGVGDDLMTALFLAHDFTKPWLLAPAMNTRMLQHPATQSSLERLRSWGCSLLEPATGSLACGEIGDGRLMEPDLIVRAIERSLQDRSNPTTSALSVLVTGGGTAEPIDAVRRITNTSTGRTGALIADTLLADGHYVRYLSSVDGIRPASTRERLTVDTFMTFADLEKKLKESLAQTKFDAVIHAAAVSDYSLADAPESTKIESSAGELVLTLKRNPKLVQSIRSWSKNKNLTLVAFKLAAGSDTLTEKVIALGNQSEADWVVANDASTLPSWKLYSKATQFHAPVAADKSRETLAAAVAAVLRNEERI